MKRKTAMGQTIDMATLIAKNEKVRAVGNMSVNARGDKIDGFGRVTRTRTEDVNKMYSKTVGNKSAQPTKPKPQAPQKRVQIEEQLSEVEKDLEQELEHDEIVLDEVKNKQR